MLKTSLGLAGLLVLPLMAWLLAPALICFAALCLALMPILSLLLMSRRRARSAGRRPRRGLPVRRHVRPVTVVVGVAAARGAA
jgi:hypothetical protein